MATKFEHGILKFIVANICQNIGYQCIQSSSLDLLTDLLHRYLKELTITSHKFSEHDGRTAPTLEDINITFKEMGINPSDIEEFISYVESSSPLVVPKLPVESQSDLNFLKPGAKEIVSRPIYIHEHLPPMYPEKEGCEAGESLDDKSLLLSDSADETSILDNSAAEKLQDEDSVYYKKNAKSDDEGESAREIDSVMMTTSGYISSAREGKMPEAKMPNVPLTVPKRSKSPHSRNPPSLLKKKATMEKIMRHKAQQEGIIPGNFVKHQKKSSSSPSRSPSSNRSSQPAVSKSNKADPDWDESKDESKKKKKDKDKKEKKEEKQTWVLKKDNRMRIRMRGLSKEEELRRYKERENELLAALELSAALANINVPTMSGLRVRDSSQKTPTKTEGGKNLPSKSVKFGDQLSDSDKSSEKVVVKQEKPSPPSSPGSSSYSSFNSPLHRVSTTPKPSGAAPKPSNVTHTPIKIKSEKNLLEPSPSERGLDSSQSQSSSWHSESEFSNQPRTQDADHPGNASPGDVPPSAPPFAPPFNNGPSLIPQPLSRFSFIPPFGSPVQSPALNYPPSSGPSKTRDKSPVLTPPNAPQKPVSVSARRSRSPPSSKDAPNGVSKISVKSSDKKTNKDKSDKEKKRENKKERRDKEKLREKRDKEKLKKRRDKTKLKEEKKRNRKEEKERLKKALKEKMRKEKKAKKTRREPGQAKDTLPKLTLKIQSEAGPGDQPPLAPEPKAPPKLVIKPIGGEHSSERGSGGEKAKKRPIASPPSPRDQSEGGASPVGSPSQAEVAKFSALTTHSAKSKKSSSSQGQSVPPLKIKDNLAKFKKDKDASSGVDRAESGATDSVVPPLKIKNASLYTSSSPSVQTHKHAEDKKKEKSEKKEKKKTASAPLVITSLGTVDSSDVPSPPLPSSAPQLPTPVRIPVEMPKSSKKSVPSASATASSGLLTETVGPIGHFVDDQGNEVWICPTCGKQDDGSPMIGCDTCDDWYHWLCVGIHVPPNEQDNWYCPRCVAQQKHKQPRPVGERKKRGRKRKNIVE